MSTATKSKTYSRRTAGVFLLVGLLAGVTIGGGGDVIAASTTKSVTVCADKKTNVLRYAKSNKCLKTEMALNFSGAQGAAGATGAKGGTGTTGAAGAKGDTGTAGTTGAKGDTGTAGTTGAKGDSGASITTELITINYVEAGGVGVTPCANSMWINWVTLTGTYGAHCRITLRVVVP